MNVEAIRRRWQDYYKTATPEQVIAEFEAMGVELVDIDESDVIPFEIDNKELVSANHSYVHFKWQESFFYAKSKESIELANVTVENLLKNNYHYAMAA
jgi:hypothetical protein